MEKYLRISSVMFLTLCLGNVGGAVSRFPAAKLQTLLDDTVSNSKIPGAVMSVQTPAGYWVGASGKADISGSVMTPNTQLRVASVTKQFVSALIMKLTEDNILSLDDTVAEWLPTAEIEGSEDMTIAALLDHTSGVPDHEGNREFWERVAAEPNAVWTTQDVLSLIEEKAPEFPAGTQWSYTNTGYYLLGLIIEKATGNTVADEIDARFFQPLGMERTAISRAGTKTEPYARDYSWFDMAPHEGLIDTSEWNLSWDWTAGSAVTSAADMLIWGRELFTGSLLSKGTRELMMTPTVKLPVEEKPIYYCYGFAVQKDDRGKTVYSKDGENAGVEAKLLYYPDAERIIFVAFNRSDFPLPHDSETQKSAVEILHTLVRDVSGLLDTELTQENGYTWLCSMDALGAGIDDQVSFGMHPRAAKTADAYDVHISTPLSSEAEVYFVRADRNCRRDIYPTDDTGEWFLIVQTGTEKGIALRWEMIVPLPQGKCLSMTEVDANSVVKNGTFRNMKRNVELEVPAGETRFYLIRYDAEPEEDIRLKAGWNLVACMTKRAVPDHAKLVLPAWDWNAADQLYRACNAGDILQKGKGYWMYATEACTVRFNVESSAPRESSRLRKVK